MKVYALHSSNSDYQELINLIEGLYELESTESFDEVLSAEGLKGVIFDLDSDKKSTEKQIRKLRKEKPDTVIIAFSNGLTGDALAKHQSSKSAADAYLTYPIEPAICSVLLEGVLGEVSNEDEKTIALNVLEGHKEKGLSEQAQNASDKLDEVFADEFREEYLESEAKNMSAASGIEEESDMLSLDDGDNMSDFSLSDDDATMMQSGLDLSLGDDELSLGADSDELMTIEQNNGDTETGLDLDLSDGAKESISLGEDDNSISLAEDDGFSLDDTSDDDGEDLLDLAGDDELESESLEEASNLELPSDAPDTALLDLSDGEEVDLANAEMTRPIDPDELDSLLDDEEDGDLIDPLLEETTSGVQLSEEEATKTSQVESALDDISDQALGPLQDIQTKMMEIDKLLLNDDEEDFADDEMSLIEDIESETAIAADVPEELFESSASDETATKLQAYDANEIETQLKTQQNPISADTISGHKEYVQHHQEDLVRLGETIKNLRHDREHLMKKVQNIQTKYENDQKDFLGMQAELDEKKIEIAVLKKRFLKQIEELNFQLEMASSKKDILEEKNKYLETEFDKLSKEKKLNINKIRARERELEERLELLRKDAEIQVRNRDYKILELKRRIDTLEFDVESAQVNDRKNTNNQQILEDKMEKVIKTLRSAIGQLEVDGSLEDRKRVIKKNLDV